VRFREDFDSPATIWERLAETGRRALVLDPYEGWPPPRPGPDVVSGWQFRNPLSMESWSVPSGLHSSLARRFGRPRHVTEVFGRTTTRYSLDILEKLLTGPSRTAAAAEELLRTKRYDFAWITFMASHLAGHLFWDVRELVRRERSARKRDTLESALARVYEETDRGLARVLSALPDDADLLVVSALGMGLNLSLVDALAAMLDSVLTGRNGSRRTSTESLLWRTRAKVPIRVRSAVAHALGTSLMRTVTSRLSTAGANWSETQAFMLPGDHFGQIRLNLRGREREGVVDPGEAEELSARIAEGLMTFRAPDGAPVIDSVLRGSEVAGEGARAHLLPDLVVRWANRPASEVPFVASERYGRVDRLGTGTGRSGAHTDEAWLLPVARSRRVRPLDRPPRLEDVAATAAAVWEVEIPGTPGQPLIE
jgi:predicted AlkP superfamily phosphohydrolase/phosphomutase